MIVNGRYLAYCIMHGAASPGEMLERDSMAWPRKELTGYISWLEAEWRAWERAHGLAVGSTRVGMPSNQFDRWLADRLP
jgi:hypothetical protein